jgi:broad specificity phosphatase PhoE
VPRIGGSSTTVPPVPNTNRIYLVRHGEVANPNHVVYGDLPGFHLSPKGVQQVHLTAVHLAEMELDLVLSSPLTRAVETATAIARQHGLQPVIDDRLTESGQFPHWTGHRWKTIAEVFPTELETYLDDAHTAGGSEQLEDVAKRYLSAVSDSLLEQHSCIAVVGHQDPVQAARLSLTGRHLSELRLDPPRHGEVLSIVASTDGPWIEESRWRPEPAAC